MPRPARVIRLDPPDLWRFSVASRSSKGTRYEVIIEPQQPDDPFLCECPRFNLNTHYHGEPCHHVEAAVRHLQKQVPRRVPSDGAQL